MPQSAILTGFADRVLPPADIARTIDEIAKMQCAGLSPEDITKPTLEFHTLHEIVQVLKTHEKLDFSYHKPSTLSRRVYRRCSLSGHAQLGEYIEYLRESEEERGLLRDDLTIGVTRPRRPRS